MLSTTELLVEHIISGILSLIWISGIFLCFYNFDWSYVSMIKDYWIILALVITALAYPIGIFVDTIADKFLSRWDTKIKKEYYSAPEISVMQLIYRMNDTNTTNYFTYNRFKSRVTRSSFLNFLLIGIITPIFLATNGKNISINHPLMLSILIFILFILLAGVSLYIWREVSHTIHKKTKYLWDMNIS